jgi:hypothetical protein
LLAKGKVHIVSLDLSGENLTPLLAPLVDRFPHRGGHPVDGLVGVGQIFRN